MIIDGTQVCYEVQSAVTAKDVRNIRYYYSSWADFSVESDAHGNLHLHIELTDNLSLLLKAAGCPVFSAVISWENFYRWLGDETDGQYVFPGGLRAAVTMYWMQYHLFSYLVESDSVFAARLGVPHAHSA